MAYVPLPRFLFRAPLLPLRTVSNQKTDLFSWPLGELALTLASADLTAARGSAGAVGKDDTRAGMARVTRAIDRYRRRAAFRPTPHGLWAGVGTGVLGARTAFATAIPRPALRIAWKRLADLARALLTDADVRPHVRLRRAPSVIQGARTVIWLGPVDRGSEGGGRVVEKRADLDDLLINVLNVTAAWTPWSEVRAAVTGSDGSDHESSLGRADDDQVDDLLLTMIDDGLLHADLVPPLVGPVPEDWMRIRLATTGNMGAVAATEGRLSDVAVIADVGARLTEARQAAAAGDLAALTAILAVLPGATTASGVHATLLFHPRTPPTLSRPAIARAAALTPVLLGLQEALVPPAAERGPDVGLAEALDSTTEVFGAGALDLGALSLGDYGVSATTAETDDGAQAIGTQAATAGAPPRALLTLLFDAIVQATRDHASEVHLRSEDIAPLLPHVALPATCELFVTPCRARAGKPAGEGWMLGLHAPAGASWGRFAHALGGDAAAALLEPLRDAELAARPGEQRLDVAFAPHDTLGDICAHPALRPAVLALTSWPADDSSTLTVADLELCADAAALAPLALRHTRGTPVAPTPLHRVRSTTAPGGIWRLLVGWNLYRQHAPWALILGPLGDLDWTPRMVIDGFVVAPASWRLPAAFAARTASARELRAWRKRWAVPRFVQVGTEDELLPVDLTAPTAAVDLAGQQRVFEIWPPLDDTPDASGRRIEAIVALADHPDEEASAFIRAALAGAETAGVVPPPRRARRASDGQEWASFKLFGHADGQDDLLVDIVAPAIRQARARKHLRGWFFLRYVDGPGQRPHIRLRVRAAAPTDDLRFSRQLEQLLTPARETGDIVAVEQVPYFPEVARFGGAQALARAHTLFEGDSDLACALLTIERDGSDDDLPDLADPADLRLLCLVATFDTLARGLGLDDLARRELARRRRDAHAPDLDIETERADGRAFRSVAPPLRDFLSGQAPTRIAAALGVYHKRARTAGQDIDTALRDRLLAPLLHLSAIRLMGLDRAAEIRAYSYWSRTLESLARHRPA